MSCPPLSLDYRSNYNPSLYQNGGRESPSSSAVEQFSFSDLPNLDYGSPDEDEGVLGREEEGEEEGRGRKDRRKALYVEVITPSLSLPLPPSLPPSFLSPTVELTTKGDQMLHVLKELQTSSSSKLRYIALQSLFTLTREYPEKCNWEEHFKTTLLKLVETISDSDPGVRTVSLRVLREILKTQHDRLRDYAELTTMKVLKAFADSDASVSYGAPVPCRKEGWGDEEGRRREGRREGRMGGKLTVT